VLRAIRQWGLAPVHSTMLQVPRALAVSVLAAIVDVALLVLLVERARWSAAHAAVLSYAPGCVLTYLLCLWWVFPAAPRQVNAGFAVFTLLSLGGLGITWLTMTVVHEGAHVNYAATKVLALALSFAWNFMSRKWLVFQPAAREA
jgi:putative flippase GtrA